MALGEAAFVLLSCVYRELALTYEQAHPGDFVRVNEGLSRRAIRTMMELRLELADSVEVDTAFGALVAKLRGAMLAAEEAARATRG
ncbi:hypothetical protein [Methylobacterium crusticola]|uniref:hypothetical protein n=1 Tax=Methylobacterium crusticola TaxID=1697972 RepID=UPI000FFC06A1|nr:hypothetical protein [Methylobacterium crusticola]